MCMIIQKTCIITNTNISNISCKIKKNHFINRFSLNRFDLDTNFLNWTQIRIFIFIKKLHAKIDYYNQKNADDIEMHLFI